MRRPPRALRVLAALWLVGMLAGLAGVAVRVALETGGRGVELVVDLEALRAVAGEAGLGAALASLRASGATAVAVPELTLADLPRRGLGWPASGATGGPPGEAGGTWYVPARPRWLEERLCGRRAAAGGGACPGSGSEGGLRVQLPPAASPALGLGPHPDDLALVRRHGLAVVARLAPVHAESPAGLARRLAWWEGGGEVRAVLVPETGVPPGPPTQVLEAWLRARGAVVAVPGHAVPAGLSWVRAAAWAAPPTSEQAGSPSGAPDPSLLAAAVEHGGVRVLYLGPQAALWGGEGLRRAVTALADALVARDFPPGPARPLPGSARALQALVALGAGAGCVLLVGRFVAGSPAGAVLAAAVPVGLGAAAAAGEVRLAAWAVVLATPAWCAEALLRRAALRAPFRPADGRRPPAVAALGDGLAAAVPGLLGMASLLALGPGAGAGEVGWAAAVGSLGALAAWRARRAAGWPAPAGLAPRPGTWWWARLCAVAHGLPRALGAPVPLPAALGAAAVLAVAALPPLWVTAGIAASSEVGTAAGPALTAGAPRPAAPAPWAGAAAVARLRGGELAATLVGIGVAAGAAAGASRGAWAGEVAGALAAGGWAAALAAVGASRAPAAGWLGGAACGLGIGLAVGVLAAGVLTLTRRRGRPATETPVPGAGAG